MSSRRVVCANCGERGHVFRQCAKPVTSCGIICRRPDTGGFLVVQRRDSFAFVEFMRGKYSVRDRGYLLRLFDGMTRLERAAIADADFHSLWESLWNGFCRSRRRPEYDDAGRKFALLRDTISGLLVSTRGREEPEWGFPKGRRAASSESDIDCALREMEEETGIGREHVRLLGPGEPGGAARFEETFLGNNGVTYRHVYFLASLADTRAALKTCDREIKEARWTPPEEVAVLVSDAPTRAALFGDVMGYIERTSRAKTRPDSPDPPLARPRGGFRRREAAVSAGARR